MAETQTTTATMIAERLGDCECHVDVDGGISVGEDTRLEQVSLVLATALNNLDAVPHTPLASFTATDATATRIALAIVYTWKMCMW